MEPSLPMDKQSSGKTHTIQGNKEQPEIIPLSIRHIFSKIEGFDFFFFVLFFFVLLSNLNVFRPSFLLTEDSNREYLLRVSYMEIYNENISREDPAHRGYFISYHPGGDSWIPADIRKGGVCVPD